MIPGDKVLVYQDPITQMKCEGRAKLIKHGTASSQEIETGIWLEHWVVQFFDEYVTFERWVRTKEGRPYYNRD